MQINDFKIFQKLYQLRSINKTAKELEYAQSNITARLKNMENELQAKLFIRSAQGLKATTDGELTYQYVQLVLSEGEKLSAKLSANNNHKDIIISELLFNYLVLHKKQYALDEYKFQVKKSTEITNLKGVSASSVITYANFKNINYYLIETHHLTSNYFSNTSDNSQQPFFINSDVNCPFRASTLRNISDESKIIEVDSWSSILELIKQKQGCALLPTYLGAENDFTSIGTKPVQIPYRCFKLI